MKFSLIHPSRNRPQLAQAAYKEWINKASGNNEIEYILSVDNDDVYINKYRDMGGLVINNNNSAIEAINTAAEQATGDVLIVVSDDFGCPFHWDNELTKVIEESGKDFFTVFVHDGLYGQLQTLPILSRKYYDHFGYIYFPGYKHMFCDTEFTEVSNLLNATIEARHIIFEHRHYSRADVGIKMDVVSKKADSTWKQGEKLYNVRKSNNFGLEI